MMPSGGGPPSIGRVRRVIFDLRLELMMHGNPLLCLLAPYGERIEVLVNTAHGSLGYEHAAYHAEHGVADRPFWCSVGDACGYVRPPHERDGQT